MKIVRDGCVTTRTYDSGAASVITHASEAAAEEYVTSCQSASPAPKSAAKKVVAKKSVKKPAAKKKAKR